MEFLEKIIGFFVVRPNTKDSNQWFEGWDSAKIDFEFVNIIRKWRLND